MTMTPEERAVINAAIEANRIGRGLEPSTAQLTILRQAVHKLIFACPRCNAGGHTCPGDGNPIGHADSDCGEHDDAVTKPSEERAHLTYQLREIAQGTMQEWMRIVDLEDVAGIHFQARVTWEDHQGAMVLGEHPRSSEFGAFQVNVSVEDLGPVQPLDPENDPAQIEEMREEPPQWYARTMADVRPGDTIRPKPGAPESRVTARCWPPTDDARGRGSWHVIEGGGGHWDDHVIQPGECCVHLDGAGHRLFRPTFGVEILLAPSEVRAIELLGGWDNRERMKAS